MSRSVKITRSGAELRGGGRAAAGQIVHMLDAEADVLVDRGEATELNTISQAIMPTPANGDVLTYVTSDGRWENKPASNPTDPTFASLHVTGASTLDGVFQIDTADQRADGSLDRVYFAQDPYNDGVYIYSARVAANGTVLAEGPGTLNILGARNTFGLNADGHASSSAALGFGGFTTGSFGDTATGISYDNTAFIQWALIEGDNGNPILEGFVYKFTGSIGALWILDSATGNMGVGATFSSGLENRPQATLHVAGTLLIDGNVGFNGANPSQPTLATGAGATVDQVVAALQTLGLVKQS